MDSSFRELLDLVLRWLHVIAGIMWVGNSLLFNWLDRNLQKRASKPKEHIGDIWLLHSGAFYEVEKKMLAPGQMPDVLHWFKWQSYTTWLSGISLLIVVYYMGDGAYLVDAGGKYSVDAAKDIGLGLLAFGFATYDIMWRTIGKRAERLAHALTVLLLVAIVFIATHVFSGRAAFIHVGAAIGTFMAGNVFFHIIPSQKELVGATKAGREQDMSYSVRAKQRSIHNNYLTFPLLFLMISNHFPSSYGSSKNAFFLLFIILVGASIRHVLNIRFDFKAWPLAFATVMTIGVVGTGWFFGVRQGKSGGGGQVERVAFSRVQLVIRDRCMPCHSEHPTDPTVQTAPNGVMFDTPEQIKAYSDRIKVRAVISKTMPQGNKTGITEEERDLLGKWILGGASTQ
ncbi:MAG: urate hydroxylase PuuD [Polyangiaceae bacterium]